MMTASSMRSPWGKFWAITLSAFTESGLVVRLASEVNADPIRVAMATTEATTISPHAATTRQGWIAAARASLWVIDVLLACTCWSSRLLKRVANMTSSSQWISAWRGWSAKCAGRLVVRWV
jgi:hypothetical protein